MPAESQRQQQAARFGESAPATGSQTHRPPSREREREGGWEEPQTQYHSLALGAKFKTRSCKRFVALNSAFAAANELCVRAAVSFAATKFSMNE